MHSSVRRVKCDEGRAVCLRCASTERKCDGYDEPTFGSVYFPRASTAVDAGLSANVHPCAHSRRSFNFFVQHTCHQLAGFFGSPFWQRLVLQAAHHEEAIRHALVAIGSIHEYRTLGQTSYRMFALGQYNIAIRKLLAPFSKDGKQAIDVYLISAILFTCFEVSIVLQNRPHSHCSRVYLRTEHTRPPWSSHCPYSRCLKASTRDCP